jgi:hypothetical protein
MLLGVILVVAVVVGVSVSLTKSPPPLDPSPEPTMSPTTPAPTTPAPTVSPTSSERLEEFLNSLESISDRALLDDLTTPQSEAARWLANRDGARIDLQETTSSMLAERYLMALTYFATNADEIEMDISRSLGFLTEASVCSWNDGTNGVFCENGNEVTNISLRTLSLFVDPCYPEVPHFLLSHTSSTFQVHLDLMAQFHLKFSNCHYCGDSILVRLIVSTFYDRSS